MRYALGEYILYRSKENRRTERKHHSPATIKMAANRGFAVLYISLPRILGPLDPCMITAASCGKLVRFSGKCPFWQFGTKNRVSRMRRQSLLLEPCKRMTTLSRKRSSDSCSYKQAKKSRSVRILVRAEKKRRAFPFTLTKSMHSRKKDRLFKDLKKLIKRDGVSLLFGKRTTGGFFSFLHEMVRYAGLQSGDMQQQMERQGTRR